MLTNIHSGDSGYTSLAEGNRARKDAPLLTAQGDLDEASTEIGMAVTGGYLPEEFDALLRGAQQTLTRFSRHLADAPVDKHDDETVVLETLDAVCERYSSEQLPGEALSPRSDTVAHLESARAVTRRAERSLWTLSFDGQSPSAEQAAVFLNRLADTLTLVAVRVHRGADRDYPIGACGSTG